MSSVLQVVEFIFISFEMLCVRNEFSRHLLSSLELTKYKIFVATNTSQIIQSWDLSMGYKLKTILFSLD